MTHHTIKSAKEISFHGVPFGYIDQTGHFAIWKVMKLLEAADDTLTLSKQSADDPRLYYVAVHQIMRINTDIHRDVNVLAKLVPNVVCRFVRFKRSSLVMNRTFIDELTGKCYVEDFLKSVRVDINSMTPIPIPDSSIELWKKQSALDVSIPEGIDSREFPQQPATEDSYVYQTRVLYSDIDDYNHTNHTAYVTFCMDCATSAALEGFYKHFTSDMCWYPVEEVDIQYIGESKANDDLLVCTWQDDKLIQKFYFIISLHGKAICKASLLFSLEKTERALQ